MFERLGIAAEMQAKTLLEPGSVQAADKVVAGEAEILLTLVSEILPVEGMELLGPLPARVPELHLASTLRSARASTRCRRGTRVRRCVAAPAASRDVRGEGHRAMRAAGGQHSMSRPSLAPAASAHHSTALVYDRDGALIEAEGVITEVAWVNPHVRFKMRGAGADGVERALGHRVELREHREPLRPHGRARRGRQRASRSPATAGGSSTTSCGSRTCCCRAARKSCSARPSSRAGRSKRSAATSAAPSPPTRSNLGLFRVWTNATNPPAFWGSDLPLTPSAAAARAAFDPAHATSRRRTARRKACRSSWSSRIRWSSSRPATRSSSRWRSTTPCGASR